MASGCTTYLAAAFLVVVSRVVAASLGPSPAGAMAASSLQAHGAEQALPEQAIAESLDATWPQVEAQSWPDCVVGPDNYKYIFLGAVPGGTKELHIDLRKQWDGESGPMLCLRRGGPPLPSNTTWLSLSGAATAAGWAVNSSFVGACGPFVADMHLALSEAHVLEGPWWLALFTDPSETRFQSKMIQRGPVYPFSLNVTIAGCGSGEQCQQNKLGSLQAGGGLDSDATASQAPLRLASSPPSFVEAMLQNGQTLLSTLESTLPWSNPAPSARSDPTAAAPAATSAECYSANQSFPLYVPSPATLNLSLRLLQSPDGSPLPNFSAQLRWGATPVVPSMGAPVPDGQISIPSAGLLEAQVPNARAGWWYLRIVSENATGDGRFCVESWQWEAIGCEEGRAGERCAWPVTRLGRVLTSPSFSALYRPTSWADTAGGWFTVHMSPPLAAISQRAVQIRLINAESPSSSLVASGRWAYLSFPISDVSAGQTLAVEARWSKDSSPSGRVHLFSKLGAAPTADDFDFATSFNGSTKASKKVGVGQDWPADGAARLSRGKTDSLSVSVQYPAAGAWYVGLFFAPILEDTWPAASDPPGEVLPVELRVRVGGCPRDCSGHGNCASYFDEGRARVWSTCECDRTHGGVDCSVEVLFPDQESRHVLALTLSNAAAIPAAGWAFTHQAYPEWIVFTCGGLASAVYHMCDAGSTCLAQYGTLQFADFLLSFLAVVLTCLHLAPLPPRATAPAQLSATLLLALVAKDNATSGWSLVIVAALGALALALGWGLEAGMHRKRQPDGPHQSWGAHMRHVLEAKWLRCVALPTTAPALVRWFGRRYRWPYLVGGLAMLGLAAAAWAFESGPTYWFWHSLWHVAIFMCPFFLLSATTAPQDARGSAAAQGYAAVLDEETDQCADVEERELRVVVEPPRSSLPAGEGLSS
ncbi:hypothetical protein KFL_003680090 [Klebsormidium nitens]|uniref:EGF-like domain-containing protein n=1 Tax=Klebsormidium nitens TaxID=105231 RepID=A0A1Y1IE11_KLENI|nr:hypothetical protein KFL_003680090 [Klebsormidium nitens]|eukprot:GAQ87659.1 hypothetical protein KFL_003680090 [Klebsormidium nitens]